MIRRIVLPVIFIVLAAGFWFSPNFKEIAAGVAIFLFGMIFLEDGFRAFTGGILEKLLAKTTNKLWKSISFGVVTTTIMQSSSLVSVITISFLSAGLIGLAAGIGIIFGANLGTTTGAWLIAGFGLKVKISAYAMPMLVFGIVLVFQKSRNLKGIGYILAGLGLLFLGIHYMKEGFEAFREAFDLSKFAIAGYPGLFLFALIGLAATVVMQSSHATLVLIITALSVGQVTYENALALAIGANIGTTITAIIGAMSANYQGKRLAAAHLIFNVITGLIAIIFIWQIIAAVEWISRHVGISPSDYTLKLAVFHTLFNTIGVLVMSPFVTQLVRFLKKALPAPKTTIVEPHFLTESVIDFPETLLEAVHNEIFHLYDNAFSIYTCGLSIDPELVFSDADLEEELGKSRKVTHCDIDAEYLSRIKPLHASIVEFSGNAQTRLAPEFSNQLYELRTASQRIVQAVKDTKHLQKNVQTYITCDNAAIRREYNAIRINIARILRIIDRLHKGHDADMFSLDEYKLAASEKRKTTLQDLDDMIRKGQITGEMATSLMNDLSYSKAIINNLARTGRILFRERDSGLRDAEDMVTLDDEDIHDLAEDETA